MNAYFVVALFLVFYYIGSQEESTDIGKNMYANWNIGILIMLQKNTLVCAYWSMCGKYDEYGISIPISIMGTTQLSFITI